ncbi:hypothetical protein GXP67_24115 [Rhodocytophaga rosea]|uniref:DUF4369 domain-containing protein n=1 Tax=Rhodocytophaga rosea TaxID=2704465 RepID=A0A6C0GN93_9BACT|nr:hypothetical protein [Rhodocytophaga rosea]QHT69508.1 hypothetical protein GXP67_24115 [Rhodocytophaga rosea]
MSSIKIILPFLINCLATSYYVLAQSTSDFIINAGEVATEIIPSEAQYRFPQFEKGEVHFRDNTFIRATLNYNLLYGEMQFINHQGDTLALTEDYKLKHITVGKHLFFYAYKVGFLEILSSYSQLKLARKLNLEIKKSAVKLVGGSGGTFAGGPGNNMNGPGKGSSYSSGFSYRELYTRKAPGDLQLAKKDTYFIVDKNDRFYEATKATVIKLFPRYKKAINAYIKEYKPDFNHRNDMQGLLAFCSQLSAK